MLKTLCSILIGAACVGGLAVQAAPVLHGVSAANVTVQQNDTGNTANSVTLLPTLSINDFRVTVAGTSRADYGVQIGPVATNNVVNGILISSISDNGRNNGETNPWAGTIYGTAGIDSNASANPGSSGIWWVPVFGNSTDNTTTPATYSYNEYNFDFSAGYFPYAKGWYGGWLCNSGGTNGGVNNRFIGNTNLVFGTDPSSDVQTEVSGNAIVNLTRLGLNSLSNAVMICCGGKNEENFAVSKPNADGSWTVTCRDDQSGSAEQDYIAWVVVPLSNTNVITGRIAGNPNTADNLCINEMQNAPFTATHIGTGTYHLTIPGALPGKGVLIISGDEDQRAGDTGNADNFVSYQATNDGWIIQTRDTGNNQTPNLQNISNPNVNNPNIGQTIADFVYIPAPTPGITVTPTNGLATSQNGGTASFTVVLDAPPTAEVDLNLATSDNTIGVTSINTLAFMPTNWNVPQTVTVTGVDSTVSAVQNYTVDFSAATSADTNYNGLTASSVALVNIPNDQPGIFLVPATGLTTTGAGGTATFEVILNFAPASDVTVGFSSSAADQGFVTPGSVTFNASNWSTPQVVTVTGVDDGLVDGNINYQILSSPAVSDDSTYNGLSAGSVSVVNLESDVAGIVTSVTNSISVLEGDTTSFTVALSAAPVSNVSVTYASSDTAAGTLSPTTLNFTPANWNVPQTVMLTGIANPANGNVTYALTATVSSTNPGYATLVIPDLTAITTKAVGLSSVTTVYGLGMPPVGIDGQATASDAVDFDGATLTFTLTANTDSTDILGVRNDGVNAGQIGVSGNTISYGGNSIATFTGGSGATPLVVTISDGVIGDAVAALVEAVTFSSTTTNNFATRTAQVTLNYGSNGSSTVSKNIRVGQLRVTQYQNGADWGYGVYNSGANVELAETNAAGFPAGSSAANGLFVQASAASNAHQVLLQFGDLIGTNAGQIPPGAIIVSADVNLNLLKSGDGWAFNRMLVPWDTNASWTSFEYGSGVYVGDEVTAETEYDSQLGNFILATNGDGTVTASMSAVGLGYASIGVTPDVQTWVNGQTNCGWVLNSSQPWPANLTTGTGFTPSEDPNVVIRPRLRVYWLPAGTASASFRNGVNNYAGVSDTEILQTQPNTVVNPAATVIWSDGADLGQAPDATEALLRFDGIIGSGTNQVPPGAHVEVAMLNLASMNDVNSPGDGGQFYALLRPWQDTTTTWNSWDASGNGIVNDGVQAAVTPTATAGSPTLTPNVVGGFHAFEVTPDVQNWANGTSPNYGWGAVPWLNGSDGWGINSSEDPTTNTRPQLVVYYTLPIGYIAPPALLPLSVATTQVQVPFSGTVGATYTVWRTDSLNGIWSSVGTATVGPDGTATFTDNAPLPVSAFYRVSNP